MKLMYFLRSFCFFWIIVCYACAPLNQPNVTKELKENNSEQDNIDAMFSYGQEWIQIDSSDYHARLALGTGYLLTKQYSLALPHFDFLYQTAPDSFAVVNNYSQCLYYSRQYKEALNVLHLYLTRNYDDGLVLNIASIYYQEKKYDSVIFYAKQVNVNSQNSSNINILIVQALLKLNKDKDTICTYIKRIQKDKMPFEFKNLCD